MMIYDTLKLSRSLRDKAHFTADQAEGLAEALSEAAEGDIATKSDIMGLKAGIAELKAELLKFMAAQTIALILAVAAIVRFLH
jgi:hypothetical protein